MDNNLKIALCREIICKSAEYAIETADEYRAVIMCLEVILDYDDD